jgi:hypothetical protein
MSGHRMNWRRLTDRRRMRRQSTEDVKSAAPFMAPLLNKPAYRRPPTKTEQRRQAAAAFIAWRAREAAKPRGNQ